MLIPVSILVLILCLFCLFVFVSLPPYLDEIFVEQQNFSFFSVDSKVHQSISGSRTQMALAKSTLESQESNFLQTVLSSVTTPLDVTSFNREETIRISEWRSMPLVDVSVTSNEAFLSDDEFISSFPKAQWTPPLKSSAVLPDHHSNTVEPPREALETLLLTPSLSVFFIPYEILKTAQQKTPLSAVPSHSNTLTESKPFVPDSEILSSSRDLHLPNTGVYFTPIPLEETGEVWENVNRSLTSLLSEATSQEPPVHLQLLDRDSHVAADATAQSIDPNGDNYTDVSSRATEVLGVRTYPAPSSPWATPAAAAASAEPGLFAISLPLAPFPGHSAVVSADAGVVLNASLFTHHFSSTAPNLPAGPEIPSQPELVSELISPVPFTRSYGPCLNCDSVSLLPEAGFAPEHDVGLSLIHI